MRTVILMDSETERKGIPKLLNRYAKVVRSYTLTASELRRELGEADAIVTGGFGKVSKSEIESAPKLKIIAVAAAGYESVDVQTATSRGIPVVRAGTADVEGVAEQAVGFMIMLAKKTNVAISELRKGNWKYRNSPEALGSELFGKTAGIVGFGMVGRALGRKASGMGMRLLVFDPYLKRREVKGFGARFVGLKKLLALSDYVCLAAALTSETRHAIGANEIELMKPGAFLINIARGGMIDEEALFLALRKKRIAGAGLDVLEKEPPTDCPLLQLDNCIVTPHTAGATVERTSDIGRVIVREVKRVLSGHPPSPANWINPKVKRLNE